MSKQWVALFSRTGSEITEISKKLGRWPAKIITNKQDLSNVSKELLDKHKVVQIPAKPTLQQYFKAIGPGFLVTLNGYLRIVPGELCTAYEIYNGHPGLILPDAHPELIGKDPQKRALEAGHKEVGCVIHKAIAAVDKGPILAHKAIPNTFKTEDEILQGLHNVSVSLWVEFLKEKLK